ncbi:MAG: prepilin-type N-terminal cleavage/methylation domain-containing protein [Candidatus Omnitrophica bacterium]|nr:prepilin-type N-terminal cleavage/methylation domain-containing protein [Candidatus Omnitrophota bacterium]
MNRKAFTLVELLIVVVIVALLTAFAIPSLEGMVWQGRYAEVFSTFGTIAQAKSAYFAAYGTYEGNPPYDFTDCLAGRDIPPGSTRVQQDLGISISDKSYFQYLIYPSVEYPAENALYFRQIPFEWAYLWDYSNGQWAAYGGEDSPAKRYFRPPS